MKTIRISVERCRSLIFSGPRVTLVAGVIAFGILLFVLLDFLDGPGHWQWPFGLDTEFTPAASFSSLILLSAAAVALLGDPLGRPGAARIGVGILLAFMGLDEAFIVHEKAESLTGIDWQILYAPIVVVCGIAWLAVLFTELDGRLTQAIWVAGAGFWAISQVLEMFQWEGDSAVPLHPWTFYLEEAFEMAGSACWLLALLIQARSFAEDDVERDDGFAEAMLQPSDQSG